MLILSSSGEPDSAVGTATGYELDDRGVVLKSRQVVHTGSGAHPAFYPMGTEGSYSGGKEAGA
jgi:hypothetical protein